MPLYHSKPPTRVRPISHRAHNSIACTQIAAVVFVLRLTFPLLLSHPEWL